MSPSDYEMIEQGYDPPRMNEGELVYTGPGELAALRTQNAELVAALEKAREALRLPEWPSKITRNDAIIEIDIALALALAKAKP